MITPTVHQLLSHYWELFLINDNKPIAKFSSQASEAWNKYVRYFKSGPGSKARQMNQKVNIRDVFARMALKSQL